MAMKTLITLLRSGPVVPVSKIDRLRKDIDLIVAEIEGVQP